MTENRRIAFGRVARVLAAAALLAFGATELGAQGATGKIQGTVIDPTGQPVANAQVFILGTAFAALTNETLLLLGARNCFRDQVLEVCPACVVSDQSAESLQRTLEGSSLDTICQMVATGAGVTVVPQLMPLNEALAEHVAERPFTRPAPTRTISVYYRRGFARPALINCLAEVVRAARLKGVRYCA